MTLMPPRDPARKPPAGRSAETTEREAERKRRLAAALRENLKRRKAPRTAQDGPEAE